MNLGKNEKKKKKKKKGHEEHEYSLLFSEGASVDEEVENALLRLFFFRPQEGGDYWRLLK